MMIVLFIAFLFAFGISFISTRYMINIAKKFQLIDDKKTRFHPAQIHTGSIPRGGGIPIFLGITIPILLFLPHTPPYIAINGSLLILAIVGILDDKKDVHPYIRLITNAFAVIIAIVSGIRIPFFTNPIGEDVIMLDQYSSIFLSFLWIYWTMNILGWSGGIDGQLPGITAIAAFVLGILSLRYSLVDPQQLPVTILSSIVVGSFLGFLPWNFYPQKIMPGYGGKTIAGFILAVLGILSYAKVGTALLVLGIPMIDAIYTLIRRISSGKSPIWADRTHLHHYLLELGWSKRTITLFYYFISAILGAIALSVTQRQKLFIFLLIAVAIGGFLVWVHWFFKFSKQRDQDNG